ncbi:uncharacterized protein LAESUDRAFT_711477 [Laetiporus sulphureus 93-53]|uniref:Oxidoreductase-like domain-containing protein n=1 Tax=Laetiporus sulphureus 93-53 TaxID=1314785 RepID=A0A165GE60_9APHY|nr:uncharacterized protein LAESUDRAFT_711477 [Laetiporus sulphureus 93-53]KZT10222.1 hypothetical protein LAESUDRAFT_711477 [Laetiporus sulphureus 93-53]
MFDGFVVPDKPSEPEADECCMSGCAICVYDLYAAALEDYKLAMEALRTTLMARKIPEKEWPEDVRAAGPRNENKRAKQDPLRDITLNAFEALERSLREKQERDKSGMGPGVDGRPAPSARRSRRTSITSIGAVSEAIRWVLYSNR